MRFFLLALDSKALDSKALDSKALDGVWNVERSRRRRELKNLTELRAMQN